MNTYRINPRLFHILLVVVLLCSAIMPVRAQEGGFQETFDDPTLPGWEYSPNVSVVDSVLHVEPDGFAFHGGQWSDLTLSLRARRIGEGFLTIRYSNSDAGAYNFGFGDKGMALLRDESGSGTELANTPVQTPAEQWVQVSITVSGGVHTISLDGQTVLTVTDPQPLPPGGLLLHAGTPAIGEFDDLALNVDGDTPISPAPTLAGETVGTYQGRLIDAHSHIPAGPEGEGMSFDAAADAMIAQMDQAGVEAAFIYGLQADYTGQEDQNILAQAQRYPGRLIPFLSGFDPDDSASVEYVRQQLATREWAGLGELYVRHSPNPEWAVPADNTVMMEIYQLAAQYDVPVAIHFEPDFQTDRTSGEAELERALQANPTTTFLLLHGAFDFATPERLASFPNLYLVREILPQEPLFDPNGLNPAENGRISVGTDLISIESLQETSSWSYLAMLNKLRQSLGQLPPEQAEAAAYKTILELVKIETPAVTAEPTPIPPQQATPVPTGQPGTWVRLGGPPGGIGYDIRYNFADPNIWYVTDSNAGVHISTDNGYTWTPSNEGILQKAGQTTGIFCLTVDPHNPQIIWTGTQNTGHIYKSTDGGLTWVPKEEGITIEYDAMSFRGFTVDPRTSDIVYAMAETSRFEEAFGGMNGVWGPGTGGVVYKTIDGGEHWQKIWDGGIPSSLARYMWINPQNPDILYVSTGIFDRGAVGEPADVNNTTDPFGGLGVLKSTDGGQTWRILNEANGLESLYIGSLYMHPDNPDILLAAAGHVVPELTIRHYAEEGHSPQGVYRTTDGGETWTQVLEPPSERSEEVLTAVEICPSDHNIAYAGGDLAVYRSEDAGQTWTLVLGGVDGWGPPGVRAGWPIDLQCDPRDPNRIFANNYLGGNFLSENGGLTWSNASDGYSGAPIVNIDVDPFDPSHVMTAGRNGAWESYDGGLTWHALQNLPNDLPRIGGEWGGVAFDRTRPGHVLLGYEAVLEHTDNGWQLHRMTGFFFPTTSDIVFAPSDASTVYLSVANCMVIHANCNPNATSVVVSHDGGITWQDISGQTLANTAVMDLAVDQFDANVVYAATSSGLFKTTDGGASWTKMSGLPDGEIRTVAVSPVNSSFILTSIHEGGFYTSSDGGANWQQVTAGLEPNGSHHRIVFDPTNPQIVYTTDLFSGIYRSMDGGLTWVKINPGYEIPATGLAVSADGQHIYIGTSGGGTYRLDLNGIPPTASQ